MKKILIIIFLCLLLFGCKKKPKTDDQNNTIDVKKVEDYIIGKYFVGNSFTNEEFYFTNNNYIYYIGKELTSKKERIIEKGTWTIKNDSLVLMCEEVVEATKDSNDEYKYVTKKSTVNHTYKVTEITDDYIKYERKQLNDKTKELSEERKELFINYIKNGLLDFDYEKLKTSL